MEGSEHSTGTAAAMLQFRRERSTVLPAELFAEPAWDLMLELFVADAEGRSMTSAEAGRRANVPISVHSRWLAHLKMAGLVVMDDSGLLKLSGAAFAGVERLMQRAKALPGALS